MESFGQPVGMYGERGHHGGPLHQVARTTLWLGLITFGVAPGLLLLGVAFRLGADKRDRAVLQLRSLGASARQVSTVILRVLLFPVLLGTGLAWVALAIAATRDWTLPIANYHLIGSDLRGGLLLASGWIALAGLLTLLVGVLVHRPWRSTAPGTSLAVKDRTPRWIWLGVLLVAVAGANWGHLVFFETDPGVAQMIRLLCAAVIVTVLPAAAAPLLTVLAQFGMWIARRARSAPALVGSRELGEHGRAAMRVSAIAGMMIVLGMQIHIMAGQGDSVLHAATADFIANDERVLEGDVSTQQPTRWVGDLLSEHDESYGVLILSRHEDSTIIRGECPSLLTAVRECPEGESTVDELGLVRPELGLYGIDPSTAVQPIEGIDGIDLDEDGASVLFVATDEESLDRNVIRSDLRQVVQPVPHPRAAGEIWAVGATDGARSTPWLMLGMVLATTMALSIASCALILELVRSADRLRAFLSIAPRRDLLSLAAFITGVPIVLTSLVGVLAGVGLIAAAMQNPYACTSVQIGDVAVLIGLALVIATLATLLGFASMSRLRLGPTAGHEAPSRTRALSPPG